MARTTILIQDDLLLEVKRVAQSKGLTITDVIKNALQAYCEAQPRTGVPSFAGIGQSKGQGSGKLGKNAKSLVRGRVDPFEGSTRGAKR